MSEQINKVLASTAQSFTTGEQKQARDNIGAQVSGNYAYDSALSSYVPYSAVSANADSAITSINGSSVGLGYPEYCDPLGLGDVMIDSARTYYSSYNWTVRDVSASGLPEMQSFAYASVPSTTGKYLISMEGNFSKFDPDSKQDVLTPGTMLEIVPGAGGTTVIRNLMHKETFSTYLYYGTLGNVENHDMFLGPWRVHFHKDAITEWSAADNKLFVEMGYAGGCGNYGSFRLTNYYPYSGQSVEQQFTVHYIYDGTDPYVHAGQPYGFPFHMPLIDPTSCEPKEQHAHRWQCDAGTTHGDWIDMSAELRYKNTNAPNSNALYLMVKGSYAYHYE